jgi:hypothetical protein
MHIVLLFTYFDKNEIKVGFHVKQFVSVTFIFWLEFNTNRVFIKESPVKHLWRSLLYFIIRQI